MSKSIYDEVLRLTEIKIDNENMYVKDKKVYHATFDLEVIELINNALRQAQKQEKLLELYKELSDLKDEVIYILMFEIDYEHLRVRIVEIEKQIKELENE